MSTTFSWAHWKGKGAEAVAQRGLQRIFLSKCTAFCEEVACFCRYCLKYYVCFSFSCFNVNYHQDAFISKWNFSSALNTACSWEKNYVEVPTGYCSPWFCFSSSVFWFAVPKSGVNELGELHSDLSSIQEANRLCNYLIQSQSNIIWKLMVPNQPRVFKRAMKLSDMQLNVIYLQRTEKFEKKNSLEDSSKYSNCKITARIFLRSMSKDCFWNSSWIPDCHSQESDGFPTEGSPSEWVIPSSLWLCKFSDI